VSWQSQLESGVEVDAGAAGLRCGGHAFVTGLPRLRRPHVSPPGGLLPVRGQIRCNMPRFCSRRSSGRAHDCRHSVASWHASVPWPPGHRQKNVTAPN